MAAATMLTACQEKKQSTVIIAPKPEAPKPSGPVVMQDMNAQNDVEWIGKTYKVVVSRKVDRELPMVEVEQGKKAYDNRINLRILRPDGSEFFNRDFTKQAFASCLDEPTKKNGVLLGIVLATPRWTPATVRIRTMTRKPKRTMASDSLNGKK